MLKPAIALYLGETYASLSLFDRAQQKHVSSVYEKTVFLPQVSFKNLLAQAQSHLKSLSTETEMPPIEVFIVTRFFDRLKQFRLGGSISQVVPKGFENSYGLRDSTALSLAASQLIIAVETPFKFDEAYFAGELERIKKINPDLNKVVISLAETMTAPDELEKLIHFFNSAEIKVFKCLSQDQGELRRTLLNAGSDGTKEEITQDLTETFGPETKISFFVDGEFKTQFENTSLYFSALSFLQNYLSRHQLSEIAYFDIETWMHIGRTQKAEWESPWGIIPIAHPAALPLGTHPFSELKLNNLGTLCYDSGHIQLEPGPVVAGRAIKPLALDLFYGQLQNLDSFQKIFPNVTQAALKAKIDNIFSALEKGQKNDDQLSANIEDLRTALVSLVQNQIKIYADNPDDIRYVGLLSSLFAPLSSNGGDFSWAEEIMQVAVEL